MILAILVVLLGFFLFTSNIYAAIIINEVLPDVPSGEKEWIELYNNSSTTTISGWVVEEKTGSDLSGTKQHPLPNFTIQNNGFWTFDFSTSSLNNSGDIITLKDNSGNIIDTYQYGSSTQSKSFGRQPDGNSWTSNLTASKGTSNGGSSSPTPSPSSSTTSSSFTISNLPSSIDSTGSFTVKVNLTLPDDPSESFYLKGAFKKDGSANYFGLTKVSSSWIKNGSSYSDQYKITLDSSGSWSGNIDIQPDIMDSGYLGSGSYIFKVGRYTSSGSGPTWSNEANITINAKEVQGSEDDESLNLSKISSKSRRSAASKSENIPDLPESVYSLENYKKNATIAGAATTPGPNTLVEDERQINWFFILGGLLVIAGVSPLVYIFIKARVK